MWQFTKHQPSQPIRDPIEDVFFPDESDNRTARHLVREAIQNSLDAKMDGEKAKVRFTFGELDDLRAFRLYAGLKKHLDADGNGLVGPPGPEVGLKFLVIDDFGTEGLTGDTEQLVDVKSDEENRFFYFWRNVGRTGKGEGTLGTWGLGKTVLPAASRINTFFGLTHRAGEENMHLMGMSVLKSHRIEEFQYDPYGYYARWENSTPYSITDQEAIAGFMRNFHVNRQMGESGLTVVIPHVVEEFTVDMLRHEVLEHYFWPILKGDLVVEIQEDYRTDPETTMDRDYIIDRARSRYDNRLERELADTIELAIWASERPNMDGMVWQPRTGAAANWDNATWTGTSIDTLRAKINDQQPFAIAVNVGFSKTDEVSIERGCRIFGRPVHYRTSRKSYFCRDGVNVASACSTNPAGFVFLVVIDRGDLANMLSAAENPSHTEFQRTDALREKYTHGTFQTIRFLQNASSAVARILERDLEEEDPGLFADVFWKVSKNQQLTKQRRKRRRGENVDPPPPPPPPPLPRPYALSQTAAGFTVLDNDDSESELEYLDVRAAYASSSGDGMKIHTRWDFDFGDPSATSIEIVANNCRWEPTESNRIRLTDLTEGYSLSVKGFDNKRDLTVTVRARRRT